MKKNHCTETPHLSNLYPNLTLLGASHINAARNDAFAMGWSRFERRVDDVAFQCLRPAPQQSSDRESAADGKEEKSAVTKPSQTPAR